MRREVLCPLIAMVMWAGVGGSVRAAVGQRAAPCAEGGPVPALRQGAARIEAVFVLDTTGSMSGLIEGAKRKIWWIANGIAKARPTPRIRLGLVAYRDRGDAYVTKTTALTADLDLLYDTLMELRAGGGGDSRESVNEALYEAVTAFEWSGGDETLRTIYLVGDWAPHMDYEDDVKYPETCRLASGKGIVINAIQCGKVPETTAVWGEIASMAGGDFFAIAQTGGIQARSTPYDAELKRHSRLLDDTLIPYGDRDALSRYEAKLDRSRHIDEHASAEALADRASFRAGSAGGTSLAGEQELISDIAEGRTALADVARDQLPETLQGLSPEALERYVWSRTEQRRGLKEEIAWLAAERQRYLKETYGSADGAFDQRVLESFRCQAMRKGYSLSLP